MQSSVRVGYGEKHGLGLLISFAVCGEMWSGGPAGLSGLMYTLAVLSSLLQLPAHTNTSHFVINFHMEFPGEHLKWFLLSTSDLPILGMFKSIRNGRSAGFISSSSSSTSP